MKYILLLLVMKSLAFANDLNIHSFEADFQQVVTNEKNNKLEYKGHITALKPQYALWQYKKPTQKSIFINDNRVTIIEPDIEQAIIKKISGDFDFFNIIKNATKISKNVYKTKFQNIEYKIKIENAKIISISYSDELENSIVIEFSNQIQNKEIGKNIFIPIVPQDYDIIEG